MYSNQKKCFHKETIESYSKTATGILIITIGLILAVLLFGSWGIATANGADGTQSAGQTASEEMPYVQSSSETEISEEQSSEVKGSEDQTPEDENSEMFISDFESLDVATGLGQGDVLVAESCDWPCLDVEAGSISLYDGYFPDTLPICVTNDWLADKYVTVAVYGGYVPIDGQIMLNQPKTGKGGAINIIWGPAEDCGCPCGAVLYTASFSVDEPIVLDSNHLPAVCVPGCAIVDGPDELGKRVCACVCTLWTGCDSQDQQFWVGGCVPCLDVEPGMIVLSDVNFPDTLPVCVTNEWLADKSITLCVYGGYEPIDGEITLDQVKTGKGGDIDITWTEMPSDCPCGGTIWVATFSVVAPIVLDSNHVPDINIPGFV